MTVCKYESIAREYPTGKKIKALVFEILNSDDWLSRLSELGQLAGGKVVGPLFSTLCSSNPHVKWRGVTAFGRVVPAMAEKKMESARIVMRRCIWSLNDESGGIGWGAPEVMAEIMANSPQICREFHSILLSYIHEDEGKPDNYLEYAPLRRGAVWGIGRLALNNAELTRPAASDLIDCLKDLDAHIRGIACWALANMGCKEAVPAISALTKAPETIELFADNSLQTITIATLARNARLKLQQ